MLPAHEQADDAADRALLDSYTSSNNTRMRMDQFQQAFLTEAAEHLEELEQALIELEENPDDIEQVARVFRSLHTIKGSGSMFGFTCLSKFTHEIENIYDLIRSGSMAVNPDLISRTLYALDIMKEMLQDDPEHVSPPLAAKSSELSAIFKQYLEAQPSKDVDTVINADMGLHQNPQSEVVPVVNSFSKSCQRVFRIRFKPSPDVFRMGTDPLLLIDELRELGNASVIPFFDSIPELDRMDPSSCYISWDVTLTTDKDINAIRDVFIFVEDDSEIDIQELDPDVDNKKVGEILAEKGDVPASVVEKIVAEKPKIGTVLVESGAVSPEKLASALKEQEHLKNVSAQKKTVEETASIKVDIFKLDKLVNLVGEMVTAQARLTQLASSQTNLGMTAVAEELERLINDLRDSAMSIRMLPIGTLFSKFKRLVRDLSTSLGKPVNLLMEGSETELDKTVIDKLNDPLVHLIRNCMDHGLETPDERVPKGKSAEGKIRLVARHSGTNVVIDIIDDGKGIDPAVIRAKAIEKGLIQPEEALSDKEIYQIIFLPGFSTAKTVSSVSGRGVGMDVVKRNIDALRGGIDITSQVGKGTTVSLMIPLTLAIVDGLLTKIDENYFVIPLSFVEECIELTANEAGKSHGQDIIKVRGEIVPYIRLRNLFEISDNMPILQQIVIVNVENRRFGLVVDNVIGDHQTVIKSLGKAFQNVQGVSGATILGDGSVALIIDVARVYHLIEAEEIC